MQSCWFLYRWLKVYIIILSECLAYPVNITLSLKDFLELNVFCKVTNNDNKLHCAITAAVIFNLKMTNASVERVYVGSVFHNVSVENNMKRREGEES